MFRTVHLQRHKSDFTIYERLSGILDLQFTAWDD